ncbi:hypothetical protein V6N11_028861 [Hibiscus sabdariffa]|uniref:Uncharacterized protein n=1 Tax=Hibiscus sabdariffa TaxID=183260 RepID=A0ABR2PR20_9ROSI
MRFGLQVFHFDFISASWLIRASFRDIEEYPDVMNIPSCYFILRPWLENLGRNSALIISGPFEIRVASVQLHNTAALHSAWLIIPGINPEKHK